MRKTGLGGIEGADTEGSERMTYYTEKQCRKLFTQIAGRRWKKGDYIVTTFDEEILAYSAHTEFLGKREKNGDIIRK